MSSVSPDPSDQRPTSTLIEFMKTRSGYPYWLAIPVLFLILKNLGIVISTTRPTDEIIRVLSIVWPVVTEQYNEIKRVGSEGDGANFAFFLMAVLLFELFLVGLRATRYVERRDTIRIDIPDVLLTIVLAWFSIVLLHFDNAMDKPKPIWDFYIDPFGLYYLRQALIANMIGATFSFVLILSVEALAKICLFLRRIATNR